MHLYISTVTLLPISAFKMGLQLVLEARYVSAISLSIAHLILTLEIVVYIPDHSVNLTAHSLMGGLTLFPSAL